MRRAGGAIRIQLRAGHTLQTTALVDAAYLRLVGQANIDFKFFGGQTIEEPAEVMRLSVDKVKHDWSMAKTWLYHESKTGE